MIISKGSAQEFPKLRGEVFGLRYPAFVEPKIDGELNWYEPGNDVPNSCLINKSGKKRFRFPIVDELVSITHRLLGELHWGDGKKGQLYEFLSHQRDDDLRFTVFDVDMKGPYTERRAWLEKTISPTPHVALIPSTMVHDRFELDDHYKFWIREGYEGAVVKSHDTRLVMGSCSWVKMKEFQSCECTITSIDPSRERIEVDPCQYMNNPIGRKPVRVGVKVPTVEKIKLRVGDIIEIEHLGVLDSGALRNPVYKPRETYVKGESPTGT